MTTQATLPAIIENEPLARYVAWRIGGPARFFTTATTVDELCAVVKWGWEHELPLFVLGGGSNSLIGDGGYPGLVIRNRAGNYRLEEHGDEVLLHIEAGAPMAGTSRQMAARSLDGLVWSEGLPGTVGGAAYGNAGCYGGDMASNLVSATVLLPSGEVEQWDQAKFVYGYRTSILKRAESSHDPISGTVILSAELRLQRDDPALLAQRIGEIAAARKSKTPSGSSCGSSFKNPPGDTAGRLLDAAGLKGTRVGGAVVSEKHANYIVNTGGATASDVMQLCDIMREHVLREFGIELELEVQLIGDGI